MFDDSLQLTIVTDTTQSCLSKSTIQIQNKVFGFIFDHPLGSYYQRRPHTSLVQNLRSRLNGSNSILWWQRDKNSLSFLTRRINMVSYHLEMFSENHMQMRNMSGIDMIRHHVIKILVDSETLKTRVADAVFKKKERQRIDKNCDIFFSMPCRQDINEARDDCVQDIIDTKECNESIESGNDGDDEDITSMTFQHKSSPSSRQINKLRSRSTPPKKGMPGNSSWMFGMLSIFRFPQGARSESGKRTATGQEKV